MAIIKIIPGAAFDQQLRTGCLKFGSIALNDRVALNFKSIANKIGDYLVGVFNTIEVVKSLRGQGGVDLPAHLGLSDSSAEALVSSMSEIIKNSVTIGSLIQGDKRTVTIRAIESDFQKFLELPGASYVSQPSNITIPIMTWLMLDPSVDIGAAAYQIVFSGDTNFRSKNSRSGRAIMVSLSKLGGSAGGGYILPDIISKTGGQNFIEGTIGQHGVAQKCAQIVIDEIK